MNITAQKAVLFLFIIYNENMNYQELEKHLFEISDQKFADFSKSLSNSDYISVGVKNPVLRNIVKEHINDEELKLEDFNLGKYLEVDFIYFSLALARIKDIDAQLDFLDKNIYKAKSWAITDCVSTYLKKLTFEKFWPFFLKNNASPYTFTRRMSYILALKLYKDKRVLDTLSYIKKDEEYMVMMAEAWLMATVAIIYEDEIYDYLAKCDDLVLKRKTISKICDSFRFNEESKNRFKALRQ